jgi:hypothetical protein
MNGYNNKDYPVHRMIPTGGLNFMNWRIALMVLFFVLVFSVPAYAGKDTTCHPPYQPTNILKLVLNYSATLDYLTDAPEQCQKPFKQDVTELVQSTWLFSKGCKDVTFEDFDEVEKKRSQRDIRSREMEISPAG